MILVFVIVVILAGLAIWITIIIIKRRRLNNKLEMIKKQGIEYRKAQKNKPRQHRGVCVGFAVSKMIPIKIAELRTSVELENVDYFERDLFQELKDTKPSYTLFFEKNIKGFNQFSQIKSKSLVIKILLEYSVSNTNSHKY